MAAVFFGVTGKHRKKKRCIPVCTLLRRQPQRTDGIQAEMHRVYDNTRHKILPSEGCFYKVVVC